MKTKINAHHGIIETTMFIDVANVYATETR